MKSWVSELLVFISLTCHYSSVKETERFNRTAENEQIKNEIISTEKPKTMYFHLLRCDRILEPNRDQISLKSKLKKK